jgi:aspartyl-tRNA(Asn)/glutamyl-tRNA(Gln) amidotransferase subunit C
LDRGSSVQWSEPESLRYNIDEVALSVEEVRKIALLARLQLSEQELQRYAQQLSAVLDYAARLGAVDTSKIPPTATVLPLTAPLRADEVRPSLPPELMLSNAPFSEAGMFRVPRVLEEQP